jgi:hypothetical protein
MYHFSLELRQKVSSERKFQRPGTRQKQKFWKPCLSWPGWCNKNDLAIRLLDLEKHLKKKAEWMKGVGEHSVQASTAKARGSGTGDKGNKKINELRTILQRESQNS